ncbi:SRPBCC family protein [Rugosimonospora africana]|uniref:Polyketide cyclase / dehydrase and lipid transport n=1 Tax=Rugosimonospora africana TaxID=556532 RepID=A0A8J3QXP1_9ACTN|nr:SRPBCC family protein [Rugosimonospora africana]GIH17738.1 hypothetical protein Raf01_59100 [Rugosimonospora africana]
MRHGSFRYDIDARCGLAEAVALMADVPRLAAIHPLAVEARELEPSPGILRSTAITSRLALGPLRFRITYRADVLSVTEDEVITVARQRPATVLRNHTRLHQDGDGVVHIRVEIAFESPYLLFPYGFRQAQYAHRGLARGITAVLEGRDPARREPTAP